MGDVRADRWTRDLTCPEREFISDGDVVGALMALGSTGATPAAPRAIGAPTTCRSPDRWERTGLFPAPQGSVLPA